MRKKIESGMSLLEILVVVTIFAVLGIITTRSVLLTLQGSKKSESTVKVRENLDYSLGVIERQLRNANSIIQCPNSDTTMLNYTDQNGVPASFSCVSASPTDTYIASGSARLTNTDVFITACSFSCVMGVAANPSSVRVSLEARDANATGVQNSTVTSSTEILLRNY